MSQLKIEKGVPVPPIAARQGQNIMLLKSMAVGDSVYFDAPIVKKAVRFYRVAQKLGIKVVIRKDAKGMRMWRVAGTATPKSAAVGSKQHARDMIAKAARREPTKAVAAKKKVSKKKARVRA